MIRNILIFLFCILTLQVGSSQIGNFIDAKTDQLLAYNNFVAISDSDTRKITFRITKNESGDAAKVEAIYRWITKNISYDNELHYNKSLQQTIYTSEANVLKNVLTRRKALCGGYAFLFKQMCKDIGIKTEVIHGFSKNGKPITKIPSRVNHTWNAVFLNGKWELLDLTWARSHGKNNEPNDFWYLTSPRDFIKSHYPENKKWTLVSDPISRQQFYKGA